MGGRQNQEQQSTPTHVKKFSREKSKHLPIWGCKPKRWGFCVSSFSFHERNHVGTHNEKSSPVTVINNEN